MTQPTFQELLTSQEARDRAAKFMPVEGNGTHFMTPAGTIMDFGNFGRSAIHKAIWQGYLQEAAPPPEPRVFNNVVYFNVLEGSGFSHVAYYDRQAADFAAKKEKIKRLACVRVEITAREGQFDD